MFHCVHWHFLQVSVHGITALVTCTYPNESPQNFPTPCLRQIPTKRSQTGKYKEVAVQDDSPCDKSHSQQVAQVFCIIMVGFDFWVQKFPLPRGWNLLKGKPLLLKIAFWCFKNAQHDLPPEKYLPRPASCHRAKYHFKGRKYLCHCSKAARVLPKHMASHSQSSKVLAQQWCEYVHSSNLSCWALSPVVATFSYKYDQAVQPAVLMQIRVLFCPE